MDQAFSEQLIKWIDIYGFGGAIFLIFVLCAEMLVRRAEGKSLWSGEGLSSLALFPFGPILQAVFINAALIGALTFFYNLSPLRVPVTWWTFPIYFLVAEFAYYWFHRVGHEVRLFWADHSIHHSAESYDFTVNLRQVPFEMVYRLLMWIPLVMLGFNPTVLVILALTLPAFQAFCHTQRIGRMAPWFEWLFVTPQNHGVHHARNEIYIDKNYGGLTMIWDHVFGTYQQMQDDVKPDFGITNPLQSNNPLKVIAHEFVPLFQDFRGAPTWRQKFGVLFGRPGQTFEMPRGGKGEAQLSVEPAE